MPRPRTDISETLEQTSFTVAEAQLQGVTRGVLRHARFATGFHGLRAASPGEHRTSGLGEETRLLASWFLPALRPGEAYSHTTALLLLGCPIRCDTTLHVITPGSALRHRRPGVSGHRTVRPFTTVLTHGRLPTVEPARAWVQAAGSLPFRELVVALDSLLNGCGSLTRETHSAGESPPVDLNTLRREVDRSGGRRLRAAMQFARVGAESRMETLTRLQLARVGLAASFELQVDVHDRTGEWIGRFDLVDRERRLIIEYDGEQHRTSRAQYLKDLRRLERARAAGYRVIRVHADELLSGSQEWIRRVAEELSVPLRPVAPGLARLFEEAW